MSDNYKNENVYSHQPWVKFTVTEQEERPSARHDFSFMDDVVDPLCTLCGLFLLFMVSFAQVGGFR